MMKTFMQKGFSIVQALVVGAGLAGLALMGTKLSQNQKMAVKDTLTRDQVERVHTMIYSILQNRLHCLVTLNASPGGVTIAPDTSRELSVISMFGQAAGEDPFKKTSSTDSASTANAKTYLGSVRITGMNLTFPSDLTTAATLTLSYTRNDGVFSGTSPKLKTSFGTKHFKKKILISMERGDATTVKGCTAVVTDTGASNAEIFEEMCNDFEYTEWDDSLQTCKVKEKLCAVGEVFQGVDNNGAPLCYPVTDFVDDLIYPSNIGFSCPNDFDSVQFSSVGTPGNRVQFECNKVNVTCASEFILWLGSDLSRCDYNLGRGFVGDVVNVIDNVDDNPFNHYRGKGTSTATCTTSGWVLTDKACTAPCPDIDSTSNSWVVNGKTCEADLPSRGNFQSVTISDATGPSVGSTTYYCNQGNWRQLNSTTTPSAANASCAIPCEEATLSWSQDADTCDAHVSASTDGSYSSPNPLTDATGSVVGTARFRCTAGSWVQQSWSGMSCETVGATPGGTCSWTGSSGWEYSDCSGFVNSTGPGSTVPVANKKACYDLCKGCISSTSFNNCMYTHNP